MTKKFKYEIGETVLDTVNNKEVKVMGVSYERSMLSINGNTTFHKSTVYTIWNPESKKCEERKFKQLQKINKIESKETTKLVGV